jgi:ubiquinone/menaquinone biosynthesis C-methylase UbiE
MRRRLQRRLFLITDRFRRRRMQDFVVTFHPSPETTILDVGGTETNWKLVDIPAEVVLLNPVRHPSPETLPPNLHWVEGDGRKLEYRDDAFDLCFSNSTIEHLHTLGDQRRFASEIRRVARSYYVQTPARSFPFEPHWLGLFVHWLPRAWQRRLVRYVTLYGLVNRPPKEQIAELVDEYRLLSRRELSELFPDAEIRRERFALMTKSYVAVRRSPST